MRRLAIVLLLLLPSGAGAQAGQASREELRLRVDDALRLAASGDFGDATDRLLTVLDWCAAPGADPAFGQDCRTLANYSLGYVHQIQGSDTGTEALLRQAVTYYDDALREDSLNADAIYNRTLAARALGDDGLPAWLATAAARDPERRGVYLSFLGDFHARRNEDARAADAYRAALAADPDTPGARAGLVATLRRAGDPGLDTLLAIADDWRFADAPAASDAYAAVLQTVMEEPVPPEGEPRADEAIVRMVLLRERIGPPPFVAPAADQPGLVSWRPSLQLDAFLRSAVPDSAPWWTRSDERRRALATAALRRGISAAAEGNAGLAERLWIAGLDVALERSAEAVDLQRELALLYTRNPSTDPEGRKFRALEDRMFVEKGEVLASGDLEAAQRFHATLARIYVERGAWEGPFARNATDQLQWALRAADERERREGFHQPLPWLRAELTTRQLRSLFESEAMLSPSVVREWERVIAAQLDVARDWLDLDDFNQARGSIGDLDGVRFSRAMIDRVVALIERRAAIGENAAACGDDPAAIALGTGEAGFVHRQQFKVLADCAARPRPSRSGQLRALALAFGDGFTLIGNHDVRRLEAVASALLREAGMPPPDGHLVRDADPAVSIAVSLPAETVPLRYALAADDRIALDVLRALGPERSDRIHVRSGILTLPAEFPEELIPRATVRGVRAIQRGGGVVRTVAR